MRRASTRWGRACGPARRASAGMPPTPRSSSASGPSTTCAIPRWQSWPWRSRRPSWIRRTTAGWTGSRGSPTSPTPARSTSASRRWWSIPIRRCASRWPPGFAPTSPRALSSSFGSAATPNRGCAPSPGGAWSAPGRCPGGWGRSRRIHCRAWRPPRPRRRGPCSRRSSNAWARAGSRTPTSLTCSASGPSCSPAPAARWRCGSSRPPASPTRSARPAARAAWRLARPAPGSPGWISSCARGPS